MLKMTVRGIEKLRKDLAIEGERNRKALDTAIKVEGYKRLRELRDDIKAGRSGGAAFAALSEIAKRTKTGRMKKNPVPLYRIARMLRYNVRYTTGLTGIGGISFSFGFISHGRRPIQSTYKQMLIKHDEGIDVLYSKDGRTALGRRLARIGGKLKKKGDPDAKYFFLRKTTGRRIKLPSRQLTEPYWSANRESALASIRRNFRLKMQGKRI